MRDNSGEEFEIAIYQSEKGLWILEIVDQCGDSFVWNDHFETDDLAYEEAVKALNSGASFDKDASEKIKIPEELLSSLH